MCGCRTRGPAWWLVCCDFAAHDADKLLAAGDAKVFSFDAEQFVSSFCPRLDCAGRNLGGVSVGGEHYSFARGNRGVDLGEKVFSGGHLSLSLVRGCGARGPAWGIILSVRRHADLPEDQEPFL